MKCDEIELPCTMLAIKPCQFGGFSKNKPEISQNVSILWYFVRSRSIESLVFNLTYLNLDTLSFLYGFIKFPSVNLSNISVDDIFVLCIVGKFVCSTFGVWHEIIPITCVVLPPVLVSSL